MAEDADIARQLEAVEIRDELERPLAFGRSLRSQFLFEEDYTNLNHGIFPKELTTIPNLRITWQAPLAHTPKLYDVRSSNSKSLLKPAQTNLFVMNIQVISTSRARLSQSSSMLTSTI